MSDREILELMEEENTRVVRCDQPLPGRILELFDREGIILLRDPGRVNKEKFRSELNRPSVIWKE
jgi:hypothetical protein